MIPRTAKQLRPLLRTNILHIKPNAPLTHRLYSVHKGDSFPRPSEAYTSKMGQQPSAPTAEPEMDPEEAKEIEEFPGFNNDEKKAVRKAMRKRSRRMTYWQMLLITILGSSVLNIMREKNLSEELDDNYKLRFQKFEELIERLKNGDAVLEDVEAELNVLNERFDSIFELPKSEFDGVRGLDKVEFKKLFCKAKGIEYVSEEQKKEQEKKKTEQSGGEEKKEKLDDDTYL
ncbi:unnamed protein product [Ambrosiozyma monospora]|uniref:Unnamed protein product n=1 Tax=Ambrosiozyma monospora TaxID=43982 RepID=A0ACB5TCP5_AMBMO|nr:unnamed protein product [Ambrosiozyma monospora]